MDVVVIGDGDAVPLQPLFSQVRIDADGGICRDVTPVAKGGDDDDGGGGDVVSLYSLDGVGDAEEDEDVFSNGFLATTNTHL